MSGDTCKGPIFTVGHSTRTFEEFVGILSQNGVGCLLDVRRYPHSRRHPQFDGEPLRERLREAGVGYSHLPELGGRRRPLGDSPNTGWRNPSFRGYADHMRTPEFEEGLRKVCEASERRPTCLMCSEAVWWRCHRRMISDALLVRGVAVEHLLGPNRRQTHSLTPWARVVDGTDLLYLPEG